LAHRPQQPTRPLRRACTLAAKVAADAPSGDPASPAGSVCRDCYWSGQLHSRRMTIRSAGMSRTFVTGVQNMLSTAVTRSVTKTRRDVSTRLGTDEAPGRFCRRCTATGRPGERVETVVWVLITQRSQVQILPPRQVKPQVRGRFRRDPEAASVRFVSSLSADAARTSRTRRIARRATERCQ